MFDHIPFLRQSKYLNKIERGIMNFHGGQFKRDNLMDFSINIPNLPLEAGYKHLLIQSIDKLIEYPEIDGRQAREALSDALNWPAHQIVLGNGATDLIYLISRAMVFKRAMILQPTFTEYDQALKQSGTRVFNHLLEGTLGFQLNTEKLAVAINDNQCEALFICNPNNPTGQFFTANEIESILKRVTSTSFLMVIDESFIAFKDRHAHHEAIKQLMSRFNILVIRSMTKTFCVPGLRIGYLFGSEKSIKRINKFRDPWALNRFALESIPYFLNEKLYLEQLRYWCDVESRFLKTALENFERIEVFDGQANFILIKLDHLNPIKWHDELIQKGFYLRTCMDFIGLEPCYFRIAVKDRLSNKALIDAMKETLI